MRRINGYNILFYILGQIILSASVILAIKANYGITVATSIPYVLSEKFTMISFGVFSYIIQGIVFVLMIIILREIKLQYILSFVSAVILGYVLDLFNYLLADWTLVTHLARSAVFASAIIIASIGVMFFIISELPILPFDIFVKKLAQKGNISFARMKLGFDISNILIATTLSFLLFGRLVGVSVGTLITAATIGPCIGLVTKLFDRWELGKRAAKLEEW